jgi:hypothetical protein
MVIQIIATQNHIKPLSMKTAQKRVMTIRSSHYPKHISKATCRFAINTPEYTKAPPKNPIVARLNYFYQRSIRMSNGFVALPKLILQNPNLTPDSIILYCHLLHFDRNGSKQGCIAKRSTLERFSNLSLHRIRKSISNLEDEGIISVVRRRNGLSDRIRINKDCRPKINEPKKVQAPKKHLSTPQPAADLPGPGELKPSNSRVKDFNSSLLKNNKTIQVISKIDSIGTDLNGLDEQMKGPTDYYLRRCSLEKRRFIKESIRPQAYNQYFANSWVIEEDLERIKLAIPADDYTADFVDKQFSNQIKDITGKDIEIVGSSALMGVNDG